VRTFYLSLGRLLAFAIFVAAFLLIVGDAQADKPLDNFQGKPPFHVKKNVTNSPTGLSPAQIKTIYHLPSSGGSKTIAIIDAYDYPTAGNDLNVFSGQFSLPSCTTTNGCFEKHKMSSRLRSDSGWALEEALDTQWAHAIAPSAKILLVEARSASGTDLLNAVNYARLRSDVIAISMSWGGSEFSSESLYDNYFTSPFGATFFASSGDSGTGVQWPAVSQNVIGVGGTTLNLDSNGNFLSETGWSGSGGGLSSFETEPGYQTTYGVPNANGRRAVPDISYEADPNSGVSVYDTTSYQGQTGWFQIGGTSVGAPQWAAIKSVGNSVTNNKLYHDAASPNNANYLRDITSGTNGACGFYCTAITGYDYVTGLGSPLTTTF